VNEISFDDTHTAGSGDPLSSVKLTDDEIKSSDCVVIVTNHSAIDYQRIVNLAPLVVDTRNALNGDVRNHSAARIIRL
jgi:UDP-N-acetyl-D-glucosamine dehydrogenase